MIIKRRGTRREEGARKRFIASRRNFMKGAGLAGFGAAAMTSGLLADINDGARAGAPPASPAACFRT